MQYNAYKESDTPGTLLATINGPVKLLQLPLPSVVAFYPTAKTNKQRNKIVGLSEEAQGTETPCMPPWQVSQWPLAAARNNCKVENRVLCKCYCAT